MKWISVEDSLPPISYLETDNAEDPYEYYPVLVYAKEFNSEGNFCVAYLVKNQNKDDWNFGDLSWELYIPGNGGDIIEKDLDTFNYWMPLPKPPIKNSEK